MILIDLLSLEPYGVKEHETVYGKLLCQCAAGHSWSSCTTCECGAIKSLLFPVCHRCQAFVGKHALVRVVNYRSKGDHTFCNQRPFGALNLKMSQKDDEKHNFPSIVSPEMAFDNTAAMIRLETLQMMMNEMKESLIEDARERACVEIISAVQDMICVFKSECNKMAWKHGLSKALKKVPKTRYGHKRELASSFDGEDVVIFELKAFLRILESAQCLEEDLADIYDLPTAFTAVILEVLKEELKYKVPTKEIIDFRRVDYYFRGTLKALGKKSVKEL